MNIKTQQRRVLVMAGGTGGHVYPALAVARQLSERGCSIEWLGTEAGIEAKLVVAEGYQLHYLQVRGIRKSGLVAKLMAPVRIIASLYAVIKIIYKMKPCLILGYGGYVSWPGGVAGWVLRQPLIIHEQNAIAGLANRLLSPLAKRRLSAFPDTLKNSDYCGNPVRSDIVELYRGVKKTHSELRLLVLGGSQGCRYFNELLPKVLELLPKSVRIEVLHQTGETLFEETEQGYLQCSRRQAVTIKPYIDDIAQAYRWADCVICRSGAMTVSEIAVAGLPALLVPFPFAIDNHQAANAQWLVDRGGAQQIAESDLNAQRLSDTILKWALNRNSLFRQSVYLRRCACVDATQRIADICLKEVMLSI